MVTPPPSFELSTIFGRTKGYLLTEQTAHDAVDGLAEVAADMIGAAYGAGVSLIGQNGQRLSVGATSNGVLEADNLQYEFGQGPCLSAWASGTPVYITDTHIDNRWEKWMSAAAKNGIRSCLSVPLLKKPAALGAMKIYSDSPDAFSDEDRKLLLNLARSAAALLGHIQASDLPQRLSKDLKISLAGRDTIDIARGILMERHSINKETAMQQIIDLATSTGTTMNDQARTISERGNNTDTSNTDPSSS